MNFVAGAIRDAVESPGTAAVVGVAAILLAGGGLYYLRLRTILREIRKRAPGLSDATLVEVIGVVTGSPVPPTLTPREFLEQLRERNRVTLVTILTIGVVTVAVVLTHHVGLADPDLHLDPPTILDVRGEYGPEHPAAERLASRAHAAAEMTLRSIKEPAKHATVDSSTLTVTAGTDVFEFEWDSFVHMYKERYNSWFGQDSSVHPFTIDAGATVSHEVLYHAIGNVTWADLLRVFAPERREEVSAILRVRARDRWLEQHCTTIDANERRAEVAEITSSGRTTSRVTMACK